jgi:hypothetical protein
MDVIDPVDVDSLTDQQVTDSVLQSLASPERVEAVITLFLHNTRIQESLSLQHVYNTLCLYAYGTWRDYCWVPQKQQQRGGSSAPRTTMMSDRFAENCEFLPLDSSHEMTLKCLTIVSMCENRSFVEYQAMMEETDIQTVQELEQVLIHHCIYPGLVSGMLDQKLGLLHVSKAVPRAVSPGNFDGMVYALNHWLDQARKVAYFLEEQVQNIDSTADKSDKISLYNQKKEEDVRKMVISSMMENKNLAPDGGSMHTQDAHGSGSRISKRRR